MHEYFCIVIVSVEEKDRIKGKNNDFFLLLHFKSLSFKSKQKRLGHDLAVSIRKMG